VCPSFIIISITVNVKICSNAKCREFASLLSLRKDPSHRLCLRGKYSPIFIRWLAAGYLCLPSYRVWIVLNKFTNTLVTDPELFDIFEISVIEVSHKYFWLFVEEGSSAVEKVIFKVALVCNFARLIVQFTPSAHQIIFPLSFITSTVLIGVLAESFALACQFIALVFAAIFELVDRVYRLSLVEFNDGLLSLRGHLLLMVGISRQGRRIGGSVCFCVIYGDWVVRMIGEFGCWLR